MADSCDNLAKTSDQQLHKIMERMHVVDIFVGDGLLCNTFALTLSLFLLPQGAIPAHRCGVCP